jgi:hypothetical protein
MGYWILLIGLTSNVTPRRILIKCYPSRGLESLYQEFWCSSSNSTLGCSRRYHTCHIELGSECSSDDGCATWCGRMGLPWWRNKSSCKLAKEHNYNTQYLISWWLGQVSILFNTWSTLICELNAAHLSFCFIAFRRSSSIGQRRRQRRNATACNTG